MPITMRDVAHIAGVSIKTVSRVVNDQGEISEATREKVLATINELGYRPSRIARAMVTQRSNTVGFVIPDITNPFFSEVARGVQDFAQTKDYNVFMCNTDEDPGEHLRMLYSLAEQGVDGIIVFTSLVSDHDLRRFADSYRPVVTINRALNHPNVSEIIVDNYKGARLAVDHLVERGHTAIGMLAGEVPLIASMRRFKGFCDTMASHGLAVNNEWIISGPPTLTQGYTATRRLLTEYPQLTALFTYNDLLALGALRACHDVGRRVPEEFAVIGYDDIQLTAMVTPSLTSVSYNKHWLGQIAMNRVLDMRDQPQLVLPKIDVDVSLTIREST